MPRTLDCQLCGVFLAEVEKGKIRKGAVLLCSGCWDKASIAIRMANMAAEQAGARRNPSADCDVVNDLMGMFGMKP